MNILQPVSNVRIVDRNLLTANDYNPNVVNEQNLELLMKSILSNGWTMPIVCRPDYTIIDGYHRWLISGREPLYSQLEGKVPVVIVEHDDKAKDIYGTITHNRARGVHLLGPMKEIIKNLMAEGKKIEEISDQLGMTKEEVFRLSDFSREDFLNLMAKDNQYSKAKLIVRY